MKDQARKYYLNVVTFLAPFALWSYIFRGFISRKIFINVDTLQIYGFTKYYINNLLNGVFPLWQPFMWFGKPFNAHFINGLYNPLIYLIAILQKCGINYYDAFLVYLNIYFFIGLLGAYFLAKELFGDKHFAVLAYVSILFSGLGILLYTQLSIVMLFFPSCWFFYFLIRFSKNFQKGEYLGIVFSLMVIINSNYPFYFFILFSIFTINYLIIYFQNSKSFIKNTIQFLKKNVVLLVMSVFAISLSLLPLFIFANNSAVQDLISPFRHMEDCIAGNNANCLEKFSQLTAQEAGGIYNLSERVHWRHLFSHLDKLSYWMDAHLFIPIFLFLSILISMAFKISRLSLLFLLMIFMLIIFSLGADTSIFSFLFQNIPILKYFRNYYFFIAYLTPLLIFLGLSQLKAVMDGNKENVPMDSKGPLYIYGLHIVFILFLFWLGDVVLSSYITIALSMILFLAYFSGKIKKEYFMKGLVLLVIIQPVHVLSLFNEHAYRVEENCTMPDQHNVPEVNYVKSPKTADQQCYSFQYIYSRSDLYYAMALEDSARLIVGYPYTVGRGVYYLHRTVNPEDLWEYLRHKFIVYDKVKFYQEDIDGSNKHANLFLKRNDFALVKMDEDMKQIDKKFLNGMSEEIFIKESSHEFKILSYGVNQFNVETHYQSPKFLVINQIFDPFWKAIVNGKKLKVFQANIGFKGIFLNKGENTIQFKYSPPFGAGVYIIIALVYIIWFIMFLWFLCNEKGTYEEE